VTSPSHHPGGKTRIALASHIRGAAFISPCGRYRPWLSRDWTTPGAPPKAVLFVGLNPSVADAHASDPTCHRELTFAQDWGFTRYFKANVMDWRATAPKDLPHDPKLARSADNMGHLRRLAGEADLIVMASGNVHPRFARLERETLDALREAGKPLKCFGKNKSGSAKHPLYLRRDAVLQDF